MFTSEDELKKQLQINAEGEGVIFGMSSEDNDSRYSLYRIKAPLIQIKKYGASLMNYAGRNNMLKSYNASSEKISDKKYIEGIIYSQDNDFVFIVSLTQAGKKADRIFTCIDSETGQEKWSVQQSGLFDYMKIDEKQNSQQSFHSTKDLITVSRYKNMVILKLKGDGLIAFDVKTGKKLWSVQPAPVGW